MQDVMRWPLCSLELTAVLTDRPSKHLCGKRSVRDDSRAMTSAPIDVLVFYGEPFLDCGRGSVEPRTLTLECANVLDWPSIDSSGMVRRTFLLGPNVCKGRSRL